jgi:hypothetical protein
MLKRLLNMFGPTTSEPNAVTKRLIPDPDKVSAGFSIWLRSLRKANDDWMALNKELKAYWGELAKRGLKQNEAGIPFDSPFTEEISRQLNKLKLEPHFQGSAKLNFELRQDVTPGWEWYEIRPNGLFHPPLNPGKLTCHADLMPQNLFWHKDGFISEKCKAVIESAKLTGLEFNWIPDVGRYQAPQWFQAMAVQPLGRGLDNPLLDPAQVSFPDTMKGRYSYESWRFGLTGVVKTNIKRDICLGIPLADQILGLSPLLEVSITGFRQMLRQFLPATDFAYIWHWTPSLCCNARAREVLIQTGILSRNDFIPIWIWNEIPEGALVLDTSNACPIPPFSLAAPDWDEFKKLLPAKQEAFEKNPKPPFTISFESVIQRLCKSLGKDCPNTSNASHLDVPKAPSVSGAIMLPGLWEKALEVSDDFTIYTDKAESNGFISGYAVVSKNQLAELNKDHSCLVKQASVGWRIKCDESNYVHFAEDDAESLAFDMSTLTDEGDCHVVEWRHDPLSMAREWKSIIHLLAESLDLWESEDSCY